MHPEYCTALIASYWQYTYIAKSILSKNLPGSTINRLLKAKMQTALQLAVFLIFFFVLTIDFKGNEEGNSTSYE